MALNTGNKLRIAWFSDLSFDRAESLSTYCSRLLLPEIIKLHEVEVFSDQAWLDKPSSVFDCAPVYHYLTAYKRHAERPFDIFFYQLEDGRAARFVRGHIGLVPGVVWVHDLFCTDLGPEACHTSPWEHTIKQFYDTKLPFSDRDKAPHQLWPKLYRESSLSPVVFFSSRWGLSEFKRMVSDRIESSPGLHLAEELPVPVDPAAFMGSVGGGDVFTIATRSVSGIEGRAHKYLPVLRDLEFDWRLRWVCAEEQRGAVSNLLREFGIDEGRVVLESDLSSSYWGEVVAKSDLALHLHTSPFGHLSPYLQVSLLNSVPSVVAMAAGGGEDLPDSVVFKIVPGMHEARQLAEVIKLVALERARRGQGALGVAGGDFLRAGSDYREVARRLSNRLVEVAPHVSYVVSRWESLAKRARVGLFDEVRELVDGDRGVAWRPYELVVAPALRELGWG